MLTFVPVVTAPLSREIKRVGEDPDHVGYIYRDSEDKAPYILFSEEYSTLTIEEMRECLAELERIVSHGKQILKITKCGNYILVPAMKEVAGKTSKGQVNASHSISESRR